MKDWLVSELRAMAGPKISAQFALDLSEERVRLLERVAEGYLLRQVVRHDDPDFEQKIARMRRHVAGRPGGPAKVDLLLPHELTLYRQETFPSVARNDLRNEVLWRLGSITQYAAEDLFFDAVIIGEDAQTGFLQVMVAIALRQSAREAEDFANAHDFVPLRITAAEKAEGFEHGPTFRIAHRRRRDSQSLKAMAVVFACICIVLSGIGVTRSLLARWEVVDTLTQRRQAAEATLAGALEKRASTLALARRAATPMVLRTDEPMALVYLNSLSASLPPLARAERIALKSGQVRIEGFAENADAVLTAVEMSNGFANARYAAPVRPSEQPDRQSFAIEASLDGQLHQQQPQQSELLPPPDSREP
ncbi:MAG: hypothetical protein MRY63_01530 [Neomegalonema sp.]|nr:hypothetical protein [Neomegalonema sp.]